MDVEALRARLRGEMEQVEAAVLLSHHRRGALIVAAQGVDLLDVAVAVATDESATIGRLLEAGDLAKPTLGELATWCMDQTLRLRFVIVQPYVLAQVIVR